MNYSKKSKKSKPILKFKIKTYRFLPAELVPVLKFDEFEAQTVNLIVRCNMKIKQKKNSLKYYVFCNDTHDGGRLEKFDTLIEAKEYLEKDIDAENIIYGILYEIC